MMRRIGIVERGRDQHHRHGEHERDGTEQRLRFLDRLAERAEREEDRAVHQIAGDKADDERGEQARLQEGGGDLAER